jgi:hypothetical protein
MRRPLLGRKAAIALLLALPAPLLHPALNITQLLLDKGFVIVSAEMSPVSPPRLSEFIDDGMNVKIELQCVLYRKTGMLIADEAVTNSMARFVVKKDVLNNGFVVTASGTADTRERWFSDTNELVPYLMSFHGVKICTLDTVGNEGSYYAEIQFHVISLELYPPLSFIFNLMGNWNFSSSKVRTRSFNRGGIFNE